MVRSNEWTDNIRTKLRKRIHVLGIEMHTISSDNKSSTSELVPANLEDLGLRQVVCDIEATCETSLFSVDMIWYQLYLFDDLEHESACFYADSVSLRGKDPECSRPDSHLQPKESRNVGRGSVFDELGAVTLADVQYRKAILYPHLFNFAYTDVE